MKIGWQPIETAPKDGTWVLVWGGETDEMMDISREECRRVVTAQYSYVRWQFAWFDGGFYGKFDKPPTHWMPLPEPPIE